MVVLKNKIKIAIAYVLLLYFLCFVVPPVSSMMSSADSFAGAKGIDVIGKHNTRERMYLYDLTLWEILKSTKRSDKLATLFHQSIEDQLRHYTAQSVGFVEGDQGMLPLLAARTCRSPRNEKLHSAIYQFTHSGLSPPVLV